MPELLTPAERDELMRHATDGGLGVGAVAVDTLWDVAAPPELVRTHRNTPRLQLRADLEAMAKMHAGAESAAALRRWLEAAIGAATPAGRDGLRAVHERRFGHSGSPGVGPVDIPQRILIRDQTVGFDFLAGGSRAGAGVACVRVPVFEGGVAKDNVFAYGTAWLATPDCVVTCNHVLHARSGELAERPDHALQAQRATVHFDWRDKANHDAGTAVTLVAESDELDVAVLRLARPPADPAALRLSARALPQKADESFVVNIIQHPLGNAKRVGLRANAVFKVDDRDLYYFTDTQEGSSGAPVFDDDWLVLGWHRAASPRSTEYLGRKLNYVNSGRRVTVLLAWLATAAPEVRAVVTLV